MLSDTEQSTELVDLDGHPLESFKQPEYHMLQNLLYMSQVQ
mgnify:CR=1 FL=1